MIHKRTSPGGATDSSPALQRWVSIGTRQPRRQAQQPNHEARCKSREPTAIAFTTQRLKGQPFTRLINLGGRTGTSSQDSVP